MPIGLFGFFRRDPYRLEKLRLSAVTPNSTVWTCEGTEKDAAAAVDRSVEDKAHLLHAGDVISMRTEKRPGRRFTLRVVNRHDAVAVVERLRR